jgi:hypothetical protein
MALRIFIILSAMLLSGCSLDSILYDPPLTAQTWCANRPCSPVQFGPFNFVLSEPTSSLLVYLLTAQTIWAAYYFWSKANGRKTMQWWGVQLLLGGIAAFFAGTSYQAFGYELKCAGREACIWTNWLEVTYNVLTVLSINALMVAVSYSSAQGKLRGAMRSFAVFSALVYFVVAMYGAGTANKFLISFEFMVLFLMPNYLTFIVLNSYRYIRYRDAAELALLSVWASLFAVIGIYFYYMFQGYTQVLWAKGIWFSENDVLHVGMVLWIAYAPWVLGKRLKDLPASK